MRGFATGVGSKADIGARPVGGHAHTADMVAKGYPAPLYLQIAPHAAPHGAIRLMATQQGSRPARMGTWRRDGLRHRVDGGLGHGLITWCCEWRCPLYPQKQTLVALQSFGLKKRTSEVGFTPESGHSHGSRKRSAYDPKRTFTASRELAVG